MKLRDIFLVYNKSVRERSDVLLKKTAQDGAADPTSGKSTENHKPNL